MTIINTNSISGINSITAQGASGVAFYDSSGSNERLRITSTGSVGVGTDALAASSRLTLFEESGNGQTLEIKAKNSGGAGSQPGIKFTAPNGDNIGGVYGDVNSDTLKIQTGGTDRVVISAGGTSEFTSDSSTVCAKFTGNGVQVIHAAGSNIFLGTQTGTDGKIGTTNNANLHLFANGYGNRITVNTSGSLSIEDGDLIVANGHGINFGSTTPDGTTPSSELLNDYEEGTWTPALSAALTIVIGYSIQTGFYTKIGNMVYAYGRVTVPAAHITGTSSSTLAITGLPFTIKSHNNHYPTGRGYGNLPNNSQNSYIIGFTNQTNAYFYKNTASAYAGISGNDLGSSNQIDYLFSITYRV